MKITSGISANGIPKLSTTWLITSVRDGSTPIPITTKAGIIVTARRTKIGICRLMNPCITIWPASVPTAELESPEQSRASAKRTLDVPPRIGSSVLCAPSSESTFVRPLLKKTLAAITSIAMLISPASVIATTTSIRVYRISRRASASLSGTIRFCIRAECR